MDLNELYKEIEKAEIDLNAKRLKYIKEALVENGGSIKLKFKKWGEDNNAFDFDDQFPVIIEIAGIPMFLTEVYVKKNDFRMVLLDYDDMTLGDFDNTGENEQVAYFINYCLNQYEKFLNSISPDRDDEAWIIGGKNRYCGRENYGTMIKRYDPIGFNVGYREWAEQPG